MSVNPPSDENNAADLTLVQQFREYLDENKRDDIAELVENYNSRNCSIEIDWDQLREFDMEFADRLRDSPNEKILTSAAKAFKDLCLEISEDGEHPGDTAISQGYIRFSGFPTKKIRQLRADDLEKFISLKGVVSKRTDVNMKLDQVKYECGYCGQLIPDVYYQEGESLNEPRECPLEDCNNTNNFRILYGDEETQFTDRQLIKLQERPEGLEGGERPAEIECRFEGDITGELNAGDRVTLSGIVRPEQKENDESTVHEAYVEGSAFSREDTDFEDIDLDEEDIEEIRELVDRVDNPLEAVKNSIAPSIHGYDNVKQALALQLFGGVTKNLPDESRVRGDIHILLIGDPGTGKSQLLQYVDNIAPRSVYSSGKGASSAGLTAAAVRDDFGDGNEWTLEAGSLVLADKGLAAIDELDKMSADDRSAMHEALEQQEISVAKAGINATLKSRCSLLGAANPKYGRFDQFEPISQQIDLEPALVSRFDLIFTMQDDGDNDEELADHILKSNKLGQVRRGEEKGRISQGKLDDVGDATDNIEPEIDPELLRRYIAYAHKIVPQLTEEAHKVIEDFYLELRGSDKDEDTEDSPVSITPRQLEAAVRLSEAHARLRLSNQVSARDAKIATMLIETTMAQVGFDPETGEFDIDMLESGTSNRQRQEINSVKKAIRHLNEENDYEKDAVPMEDIYETVEGMDNEAIEKRIRKLKEDGWILKPAGTDGYRPI